MINKMEELVQQLHEADIAYYKYDKPIMSDKEYDKLYDELVALEEKSGIVLAGSPTVKVQGFLLDGFEKVKHSKPMLSAAKTKDINEIAEFLGDESWYVSGKLDGLTLVTYFNNGEFVRGITRGNGTVGEDVTEACRFIRNLPMKIPYKYPLELRGECVMSWTEFNRINEGLTEKYSHPRNLAAGTLRQLDLNVVQERKLSYVVFECVTNTGEDSKFAELKWLDSLGFETVSRQMLLSNPKNLSVALQKTADRMTEQIKTETDYPYDGLIFELNSKRKSSLLGKTAHHENCRRALKWADDVYETTLRDIEWQIGKTGVLTPVAVFDEVDLDGALTSKATLFNLTNVKKLQLGIGDTITVFRANRVIPQVDKNMTCSDTLELPSTCPVCGEVTSIKKDNDTEVLVCTNENCPGVLLGKWEAFVSKKGMDVDGLSSATLETFLKLGYLDHVFVNLYSLGDYKKELYKLDGFGEKSIDNLLTAIEKSKDVSLMQFITAFSIPGIGASQSKVLANVFHTFDQFYYAACGDYDFSNIPGIGKILNTNIHQWVFNNGWQMLDVAQVVRFEEEQKSTPTDVSLAGKTFVITGSLNNFANRGELQKVIEDVGGKVAGSVSKNTSFLINNDTTSSSSKNKKAQSLGVPIISEDEFLSMIKK